MGERAPYSRVYWSVVDDPKFEAIYCDDHHIATWLRLLIAADAIWPASATLPTNARKSSVVALSEVGLIDLASGHRYRVHGLDAERGRRREAASRVPSGDQVDPKRLPDGPSRARDALLGSSSSGSAGLGSGPELDNQPAPEAPLLQWLAQHGCYVREGNGYHVRLITAVERHGAPAILAMFGRLAKAGVVDGDTKGFVFGALDALNPKPDLRALRDQETTDEANAAFDRRVRKTQDYIRTLKGEPA